MLDIFAWLLVYILILFGVNRAVEPWRDRLWFKIAFFPGTLLAVLVQAVGALLCVGSASRVNLFGDRRPAFAFEKERVPCLAGALFLIVSQTIFYAIYLYAATTAESWGYLYTAWTSLPSLYPAEAIEGYIFFDFRGYRLGVKCLWGDAWGRPLGYGILFHAAAGAFAQLRMGRREWSWAAIALGFFGAIASIMDWFGIGFPFLSRGWWASIFHFPNWWAAFSLFVTLAGFSLAAFSLPHLFARIAKALRSGDGKKGSPSKKEAKGRVVVEV